MSRTYRALLVLFPPAFRRRFGAEMAELFEERRRTTRGTKAAGLWLRALADLARHAPAEWIEAARGRHDAPEWRAHERTAGGRMGSFWSDCRFAGRTLAARPAFTAFAAMTLALGIGASTAIFSVVDAVLLRPLPYPEPQALVKLSGVERDDSGGIGNLSRPDFRDFEQLATTLESAGAHGAGIGAFTLTGSGEPERVPATSVSSGFFRVLRAEPLLGRLFTREEDSTAPPDIVVISHALWKRRFGGAPDVVGQSLLVNGRPGTVVGVLRPEFRFPQPDPEREPDVYAPMSFSPDFGRSGRSIRAVARLRPGVTVEQAQLELATIAAQLEQQYPETNHATSVWVRRLDLAIAGDSRRPLLLLLGAVGLVLVIACANLANLLLARGTDRRKEIAIRVALGAARVRIVRQLLTESVVLGAIGGSMGVALAAASVGALASLGAASIPRASEIAIDWRALVFAAVVSLATGLLFGLAPALQIARRDVQESLRDGTRTGHGAAHGYLRNGLIVLEVALSVTLLVTAALLGQAFLRLTGTEPGFSRDGLLTMQLSLPLARYEEGTQIGFYERLYERLRALPGVRQVGAINILPLSGGYSCDGFRIQGRPVPEGQEPCAETRSASVTYFETLGVPLLRGRTFTFDDDTRKPDVVVINDAMARQYFPSEDPIGQFIEYSSRTRGGHRRIVGVVGNVHHFGLDRAPAPEFYLPQRQNPSYHTMTLVIRTHPGFDATSLAPAVRGQIAAMDSQLPPYDVRTMEALLSRSVAEPRFRTIVLAGFACLAWALALVGVYGVVSYLVGQRTREIGIRMALGARRGDVVRLVVAEGMRPVGLGLIAGLSAAVPAARVVSTAVAGVQPFDPVTFSTVPAALLAATLVATFIPARRATRIAPMDVLRF